MQRIVARIIHVRYDNRIQVLEIGVRHYDRGLARMDDRWAGQGREGREYEDPAHGYAGDLDLFGRGSLFELLCTAQTRTGEKTLATWPLAISVCMPWLSVTLMLPFGTKPDLIALIIHSAAL